MEKHAVPYTLSTCIFHSFHILFHGFRAIFAQFAPFDVENPCLFFLCIKFSMFYASVTIHNTLWFFHISTNVFHGFSFSFSTTRFFPSISARKYNLRQGKTPRMQN